jgi:hypothetical protein
VTVGVLAAGVGLSAAQEGAPTPASGAKVKELAALMQAKKLESFSAAETGSKYVAALHIPGVQMLLISAAYLRPTDMQYRTFHKQHMEIYRDLMSSQYSTEKFFVEDALADGLALAPAKNVAADAVTNGEDRRPFDGDFDPRGRNKKKISRDDYYKAFSAADARYAELVDLLLAALKKSGLAAPLPMR